MFSQSAQSHQFQAGLHCGCTDSGSGGCPACGTEIEQRAASDQGFRVLKQLNQLSAPARIAGQLQQRSAGGSTDEGTRMASERLNHGHGLRAAHTDVTQGFQQRLAGLVQQGGTGLLSSCSLDAAGQQSLDTLKGAGILQVAQAAGRFFAHGVIL